VILPIAFELAMFVAMWSGLLGNHSASAPEMISISSLVM
jgi:hypothetical protein